ncbi:SRPBCC domain-containing protein [Agromyces sp. SYSU K20354]|uniref:SRPBCC domain-containing protein n=1 Tax=Agromyces cavernae TaxID=2898659 RepID=UPI001E40A991|nr:SRPBCC domain-containing protein [Agromyces cavernae]MCD2443679.1 SRPBCC domain-containing protein [Agromyces cavernae]
MTAKPTGHYVLKADGLYLQFDRLFHAPIEDVWYSLTNPNAMKAWIGTYTGRPATGGVRFQMTAEEGEAEWQNVSILECQRPYRFTADSGSGPTGVRVFCHLIEGGGMTTLTLGQRMKDATEAESMGPGWDYYLDRLIAARSGAELPVWDTYYPVFAPHYRELTVPSAAKA